MEYLVLYSISLVYVSVCVPVTSCYCCCCYFNYYFLKSGVDTSNSILFIQDDFAYQYLLCLHIHIWIIFYAFEECYYNIDWDYTEYVDFFGIHSRFYKIDYSSLHLVPGC